MPIILASIVIFVIALLIYIENTTFGVTRMDVHSKKTPASFNGFKIAHLSDQHISNFDHFQEKVVRDLQNEKPDIIAITGDLVNGRNYNASACIKFIDQIIKIAPVYFVSGNHEWYDYHFPSFRKQLGEKAWSCLEIVAQRL